MPLVLNGATSGSTTLTPTDAVTATLTLPSSTGTILTTANPQSGGVIQVVQGTTRAFASTNSNTASSTGLSVAITPKFSNSKIFITTNFGWSCNTQDFGYFSLAPNGTSDTNTEITCFNQSSTGATNSLYYATISYLYTPATTATQTYYLYFRCGNAPTQSMYFNGRSSGGGNGLCTITTMEIAG